MEETALNLYLNDISDTCPLSRREEEELARAIRQGDRGARDKLVEANLRFVVTVAREFQNRGLPMSDLIAEGNVGLVEAAKRFDPDRGYKFITYAVWWIRQAIRTALGGRQIVWYPANQQDAHRDHTDTQERLSQARLREVSFAEAQAVNLEGTRGRTDIGDGIRFYSGDEDAYVDNSGNNRVGDCWSVGRYGSDDPTQEGDLLGREHTEYIERILSLLTPREAEILKLYFGIDCGRLTLEEIGRQHNLTRERVRQIKEGALRKARERTERRAKQNQRAVA